jgi:perosamine synthetase
LNLKKKLIPVAAPSLVGNEREYVLDCLESTWISSTGEYIERFEAAFANFCEASHAIACCNGTAALHLALLALGVAPGDEVIVPALTFVATANAVTYCGATPVFIDSEPDTWNIDPELIEEKISARTKAIIVVHLYGQPAALEEILSIARRHGVFVIEDAAEAHGATYNGRPVGSIADIGTFSFYGNKVITTGEGGMVVTNDDRFAHRIRRLKGQGMDPNKRYWFPIVGHNYRMTNIAAAIGLAQLEKIDWHLSRRLEVAGWYRELLSDVPGVSWQAEQSRSKHSYWMFSIILSENLALLRDDVMAFLLQHGIETRPVFHPMHTLPPYRRGDGSESYPVADRISRWGISLPTWAGLNYEEVSYVYQVLSTALNSKGGLFSVPICNVATTD